MVSNPWTDVRLPYAMNTNSVLSPSTALDAFPSFRVKNRVRVHAQCTCLVRLRVDGFISGWSDEGMIWRRSGQRHARVEVPHLGGLEARLLSLSSYLVITIK